MNDSDYDGGYPNLSTARNIVLYLVSAPGVPLHKLFTNQQVRLCNFANAVSVDLNSFDTTKPCALCGVTGQAFSGCPLTQQGVVQ